MPKKKKKLRIVPFFQWNGIGSKKRSTVMNILILSYTWIYSYKVKDKGSSSLSLFWVLCSGWDYGLLRFLRFDLAYDDRAFIYYRRGDYLMDSLNFFLKTVILICSIERHWLGLLKIHYRWNRWLTKGCSDRWRKQVEKTACSLWRLHFI